MENLDAKKFYLKTEPILLFLSDIRSILTALCDREFVKSFIEIEFVGTPGENLSDGFRIKGLKPWNLRIFNVSYISSMLQKSLVRNGTRLKLVDDIKIVSKLSSLAVDAYINAIRKICAHPKFQDYAIRSYGKMEDDNYFLGVSESQINALYLYIWLRFGLALIEEVKSVLYYVNDYLHIEYDVNIDSAGLIPVTEIKTGKRYIKVHYRYK